MTVPPPVPLSGRTGGVAPSALRLGALAGLLLALCFPPVPLPLLAFVALTPLALVLERLPPGPSGARGALMAGVACGVVSWGLLLHWIPRALFPVAPWSALPLFLLVVAALALLTGAVTRLALALRTRGVPVMAGLPLLWVMGEWLRSVLPETELAWLPLGNALVTIPALAAPAEWVGVLGLSGWAALVGTVVGVHLARSGVADERAPGTWWRPLVIPTLLLLPAVAGVIRDRTLTPRPLLGVAALQLQAPGLPGRPPTPGEMQEVLASHLAAAPGRGEGLDLLLLPEGTLPSNRPVSAGEIPRILPGDPEAGGLDGLLMTLGAGAARAGVPIVAGGYAVGEEGEGPWNAALAITPQGQIQVVHRKRYLVPGMEGGSRFLFRWLSPWQEGGRGAPPVRGNEPGSLDVAGHSLGVLICYESAFPAAVRRPDTGGVEAFISLTHEGWFGRAGLLGSIPRAQHIAHLRMRAVESRSGMVRAAAHGEALIVDPRGRVVARGGDGEEGWVVGTVEGVAGESLHGGTPPLLVPGVLLLLLAALLLPGSRGSPRRLRRDTS